MNITVSGLRNLYESLKNESDRATVILAAAFLESMLADFMRDRFVVAPPDEALKGDGFAGTFSRRIALARALGWLHQDSCNDLDIVRKIRNDFAHDYDHTLGFSTRAVSDRIQSLNTVKAFVEVVKKKSAELQQTDTLATATQETIANVREPRSAFVQTAMILSIAIAGIATGNADSVTGPPSSAKLAEDMVLDLFRDVEA